MRTLFKLILLAALIYGGWYVWKNYDIPTWYKTVKTAIENKDTKGALVWPKRRGESQIDPNGIYIKNCRFNPSSLTVSQGEKVTWYHEDSVDRQVIGISIDSSLINPGKSYSKTFIEVGTFEFGCDDLMQNKGELIVK
jgi:plastocyanin